MDTISAELVRKARSGDRAAMAAIYEQTYPELWRTVRVMVRTEEEVQDVLQDAYVKAFSRMEQLQDDGAALPWLRRIAVNTARDHLKRGKPLLFSELENEEGDSPLPEPAETSVSALPEQALDREETSRLVREMMDGLTDGQRAVMGLYYYEEMSVRQIAETLEIPESTVKGQLRGGRRKVEARVRALEQEGVKLWSLAPLAFFREALRNTAPPGIPGFPVKGTGPAAGAAADAAAKGAETGTAPHSSALRVDALPPGGRLGTPIKAVAAKAVLWKRLAVGAAALVLVGGAVAGGIALAKRARRAEPPVPGPVPESVTENPTEPQETEPAERVVPMGYNEYDYNKLADFLDRKDPNGVRNGEKIDPAYDPNDPATWGSIPSQYEVKWEPQADGELHLVRIVYSCYDQDPLAGCLDLSGCTAVRELTLFNGFPSVCVDGCPALTSLDFSDNPMTELVIRDCPALTDVCANGCELRSFRAEGCPALQYVTLWRNRLTEFSAPESADLDTLCVYENELTGIDLSPFPKLRDLDLRDNGIAVLDLTPCPGIVSLLVNGNPLSELDLGPCAELRDLDCNSMELTELDLSGCEKLEYLSLAYDSSLREIDLTHCPALRQLSISDTPIAALDLSRCPELESVVIQQTGITELDLSGKKSLTNFSAFGNPLKSVDLTGCDQLKIRGVRVEGVGTLDVQLSKNERCHIAAHPGYGYHLIEWQNLAGKPLNPELQTDGEIYFYAGTYDSVVARFGK